ncbi:MAG: hypothetical protein BGO01_08960 [Armatimonadetes bacterium 55-13]|mgnify:FL=1|nr:hypothetical protein [Armatimonadota bacterium]ODU54066.1 MAG: hypothetical protein ABT09_00350 [bacterium SCN 57-13]OJU61991.1 MAG: hypothetical protein BGO01_08960 [Armatimonadetes bacterium 55-13]
MIYRETATDHRFEVTDRTPATCTGVWLDGPYEGQIVRWTAEFFRSRFVPASDVNLAPLAYPHRGRRE